MKVSREEHQYLKRLTAMFQLFQVPEQRLPSTLDLESLYKIRLNLQCPSNSEGEKGWGWGWGLPHVWMFTPPLLLLPASYLVLEVLIQNGEFYITASVCRVGLQVKHKLAKVNKKNGYKRTSRNCILIDEKINLYLIKTTLIVCMKLTTTSGKVQVFVSGQI